MIANIARCRVDEYGEWVRLILGIAREVNEVDDEKVVDEKVGISDLKSQLSLLGKNRM